MEASQESVNLRQRQDFIKQRLATINKLSGIPERFRGCFFSQLNARKDSPSFNQTLQAMEQWAHQDILGKLSAGKGIIITGPVGVGKTSLAVAAMYAAAISVQELIPKFISTSDLVHELFSLASTRRNEIRSTRLLVIDDMGKHWVSKYCNYIIEDALCGRYDNKVSTIITTNMSISAFTKAVAGHAWDRINETYDFLDIHGKSWRPLSATERQLLSEGGDTQT